MTQEAELQAIYNETDGLAAAQSEPEVAVDQEPIATEATEDAAADIADEAGDDETVTTDDEPSEDEDSEDATVEPDEAEESESATFDDLLESIPSDETLKPLLHRIPEPTKTEMLRLRDGWKETQTSLDRIGGQQGAEILAPISDLLSKSERTFDDHLAALGSMMRMNTLATTEMLVEGSLGVLFNTDKAPASRELAKAGDAVLQQRFGPGVTSDHIDKLVLLEKGGYIDVDTQLPLLQSEGTGSTLFESQAKQIEDLTTKAQELQKLVDNPELITKQTTQQTNAVKDLDAEIVNRLGEGIAPFRDRVKWDKESRLSKIVTDALLSGLKSEPEYREAINFVKQYGSLKQGDIIPHTIERQLYTLINKGKARFGEASIEINKELRGLTAKSRNAEVEKKVTTKTAPKSVQVAPSRPSYPSAELFGGSTADELGKIWAESDAAKRQAA